MDESVDVRGQQSAVSPATVVAVADADDDASRGAWIPPAGRRFLRLSHSTFLQGSVFLLASTLMASAGNYLFNVIAGRALGPDTYGALAALVSLLYLMATPSLAMQTLAAREVARLRAVGGAARGDAAGSQFHRWAMVIGLVVALLFAALGVPLDRVMDLGSPWPMPVIGVVGGAAVAASTLRGVLQGRGEFGKLALTMIADPVARLLALIVLLVLGLRFGAGLGAFVLSGASVYALAALLVRRGRGVGAEFSTDSGVGAAPRATWRTVGPYVLIAALTTVLYSVDMLVARATLPEHEAGIYAAVALLGRALYFVGAAASMVMLPLVTRQVTRGADHRQVLVQSLGFVAVLSGAGLLAYLLVPGLIVNVTYGRAFEELEANLFLMGLAMSLFAVAYIAVSYLIALGRWRMLITVAAVGVLQMALLGEFHGSVREIVLVQLAVMASLNLAVWPFALAGNRPQRTLADPQATRGDGR